jgi:hypothetical protein
MVPADNQQGADYAVNPSAGYLNAEARRSLDTANFSANRVVSVQCPRDTVLKRMLLKLVSSFDNVYASGTPLFTEMGAFSSIVPQVELIVNGNRVIKSVNPYMLRMHGMIDGGGIPRRAYTHGAAAATTARASREWLASTLATPATTQYTLFEEVVPLSFELPWNYIGTSGYDTELDIRDVASCDLKFYFGAMANLLQFGNTAPITYGGVANATSVSTQIVENRARPRPKPGDVLFDYVESTITRNIAGQQTGYQIELQTGNYLAALGFLVRNGDANTSLHDSIISGLTMKINGSSAVQGPVKYQDLQDDNVNRYDVTDPLGFADMAATIASVASAHPMKGFAFMNLLRNGSWNTAINTSRASGIDTCKLEFNTAATTGNDAATYTNNLQFLAHTHEIRPFVYTR